MVAAHGTVDFDIQYWKPGHQTSTVFRCTVGGGSCRDVKENGSLVGRSLDLVPLGYTINLPAFKVHLFHNPETILGTVSIRNMVRVRNWFIGEASFSM